MKGKNKEREAKKKVSSPKKKNTQRRQIKAVSANHFLNLDLCVAAIDFSLFSPSTNKLTQEKVKKKWKDSCHYKAPTFLLMLN